MITVPSWATEHEAAAEFAAALRAFFPATFVEHLRLSDPRPPGLKALWERPRAWLDYTPDPAELADLRPDLRPPPPGVRRQDWLPPDPPPRGIPGPIDTPLESRPPPTGDRDFKRCTP